MWDSDENGRRVLICDFCGEVIEPAKPGYYGEDYVEVNGECIHTENCISNLQRKKAYATIRDIAIELGYLPEEMKEIMKCNYMIETGEPYFSLSDCSMGTARDFITFVMDFVLKEGISLSDSGIERADDVGKYLYACIKHRKCAVCGKDGEIHHVDTIGMGNDRRRVDDSGYRKICLCRTHHKIEPQRGMQSFEQNVSRIRNCCR